MIPDFIAGLGFTDDATVLVTAIGMISSHLKQDHRDKAERTLEDLRNGAVADDAAMDETTHG